MRQKWRKKENQQVCTISVVLLLYPFLHLIWMYMKVVITNTFFKIQHKHLFLSPLKLRKQVIVSDDGSFLYLFTSKLMLEAQESCQLRDTTASHGNYCFNKLSDEFFWLDGSICRAWDRRQSSLFAI